MSTPVLATYGTLMRSFGRHEQLGVGDRLAFVTRCRWEGRLYDLGSFPGAVPGDGTVYGELFRLRDPAVWRVLDRYEGYDPAREEVSIFVRRRVDVACPDGRPAWVYWYNGDPEEGARVSSGDWAAYVDERGSPAN
jgi:gamma-glutamylcyclotransferase (GGCT)/AIG2-like uncharacterized protein YtfP